jgi:hypothetical protein
VQDERRDGDKERCRCAGEEGRWRRTQRTEDAGDDRQERELLKPTAGGNGQLTPLTAAASAEENQDRLVGKKPGERANRKGCSRQAGARNRQRRRER